MSYVVLTTIQNLLELIFIMVTNKHLLKFTGGDLIILLESCNIKQNGKKESKTILRQLSSGT